MKEKPVVYLASPYRGAKAQNEAFARLALAYAIQSGVVPVAPHLLYPQVLKEHKANERAMGMELGVSLLKRCDELWLCGNEVSLGMEMERQEALKAGILVRKISAEEIYRVFLPDEIHQREMGGQNVLEQSL